MSGKIEIIIGCMFSGKSTENIRLINRFKCIKSKILVIKHNFDKRYDDGSKLTTHNNTQIDCQSNDNLISYFTKEVFLKSDIIVVEEAQFFDDLFEFATKSADIYGKTIIVSGLDGDFKRCPFGDILKLIPHCEKVTRLNALCSDCNDGTKAYFTKRITNEAGVNVIGTNDKYKAVCRKCYLK